MPKLRHMGQHLRPSITRRRPAGREGVAELAGLRKIHLRGLGRHRPQLGIEGIMKVIKDGRNEVVVTALGVTVRVEYDPSTAATVVRVVCGPDGEGQVSVVHRTTDVPLTMPDLASVTCKVRYRKSRP